MIDASFEKIENIRKHSDADKLIRMNEATDELRAKVLLKYKQNKFKIDMIHLTGPKFLDLPNFVKDKA